MVEETKEVAEVTEVKLTDEERTALGSYGENMDQQKGALAELRLQYLRSEARVLQAIAGLEKSYMENLERLAKEKGLDVTTQAWQYDAAAGVFRRR